MQNCAQKECNVYSHVSTRVLENIATVKRFSDGEYLSPILRGIHKVIKGVLVVFDVAQKEVISDTGNKCITCLERGRNESSVIKLDQAIRIEHSQQW